MLPLTAFVVAMLSGAFGAWIGKRTGRREAGFIWGFVLGPLGWLFPVGWLLKRSA